MRGGAGKRRAGQTELRDRIAALDMDSMTPRDALELLYELKKLVY